MTRESTASGGAAAADVDGIEIGDSVGTEVTEDADAVVSMDGDTVVYADSGVERVFGYEAADLVGEPLSALVDGDGGSVPAEGLTGLTGVHREGHEIPLSVDFHEHEVDGRELRTGIVRDADPEERLERTSRVNDALRGVNEALVNASTRAELEESVVAALTADGLYEFAWLGEYDADTGRVSPRGDTSEGYLRSVSDATDRDGLPHRAVRTGEAQYCEDIESGSLAPWEGAALQAGFRSAVAVPVALDDAAYGVLTVYADEVDAFGREERDTLDELGATVANGITDVERRRTLLADTLTELEFEVSSADPLFFDGCGEGEWELELRELVPSAGDSLLAYIEVSGGDPGVVAERAREDGNVDEARVVSEHRDTGLVEVGTGGDTVVRQVTEAGANVHEASVSEGSGRFTTEVATESDIRSLVDAITDVAPDASLVAKREVERTTETAPEFRQDLAEDLTDRQQTVLQSAYRGGYFNWPRDSSGEDLADSLGIASSTFSQHLRAAERKLLSTFFDDADRDA